MTSHVGQTEVDLLLWADFQVPRTTTTGCRDSSGDRYVQTISMEALTGISVVLLIEHGIAVRKRTLKISTIDPDTFADLEENE